MSAVLLEVDGKQYPFALLGDAPQEKLTGGALKGIIGMRAKLLYFEKLRLFLIPGNWQIQDDEPVPLAPQMVKVGGPGSVIQMLSLWLQKGAPTRPKEPLETAGSTSPARVPNAAAIANGRPAPAGGVEMAFVRTSEPPPMYSFGAGGSGNLYGYGYNGALPQAVSLSGFPQRHGTPARPPPNEDEERALIDRALRESRASVQAEEEAQLRWAIEESQRLAEEQRRASEAAAAVAATRPITRASASDCAPAFGGAAPVKVEQQSAEDIRRYYEELQARRHTLPGQGVDVVAAVVPSDEEPVAWGSDSEASSSPGTPAGTEEHEDDEELPELVLLPDSEE